MIPPECQRFLTNVLIQEKQSVTYRILSREQGLNVYDSKRILHEFYKSHSNGEIEAQYIITGTLAGSGLAPETILGIKLSSSVDLEEQKSQFSTINAIHIYSLAPKNTSMVQISINESSVNKLELEASSIEKWGIIKGPQKSVKDARVPRTAAEPAPPYKKIEKQEKGLPGPKEKSGDSNKKSNTIFDSFSSGSDSGAKRRANTKKAAATIKSEPSTFKYEYVSRKNQPKERVIVADTKDTNEETLEEPTAASKRTTEQKEAQRKLLESMFDDDDDFSMSDSDKAGASGDANTETEEPIATEPEEENLQGSLPDKDNDSIMEIDDPQLEETGAQSKEVEMDVEKEEKPSVSSYVDEDDYLVTTKTGSKTKLASKSRTNSVKRTATASRGSSTGSDVNKKKKQSSLMSFFGKN